MAVVVGEEEEEGRTLLVPEPLLMVAVVKDLDSIFFVLNIQEYNNTVAVDSGHAVVPALAVQKMIDEAVFCSGF